MNRPTRAPHDAGRTCDHQQASDDCARQNERAWTIRHKDLKCPPPQRDNEKTDKQNHHKDFPNLRRPRIILVPRSIVAWFAAHHLFLPLLHGFGLFSLSIFTGTVLRLGFEAAEFVEVGRVGSMGFKGFTIRIERIVCRAGEAFHIGLGNGPRTDQHLAVGKGEDPVHVLPPETERQVLVILRTEYHGHHGHGTRSPGSFRGKSRKPDTFSRHSQLSNNL